MHQHHSVNVFMDSLLILFHSVRNVVLWGAWPVLHKLSVYSVISILELLMMFARRYVVMDFCLLWNVMTIILLVVMDAARVVRSKLDILVLEVAPLHPQHVPILEKSS